MAEANKYVRVFVLIKGVSSAAGRYSKRREDYTVFNRGLHGLFTDCSQSGANRWDLVIEHCA